MLRYLVLGLLRSGDEQHGYALVKEYRFRAGTAERINTGNFYRELTRLVADGLIAIVARAPGTDPRRAPYRITPRGIEEFDRWLEAPRQVAVGNHDDELAVMVLFLADADATIARKGILRLREDLWLRSKMLERGARVPRGGAPDPARWDAAQLLQARRQKQIAAEVEFLDELAAAYETWAATGRGQRRKSSRPSDVPRAPRVGREGK